MSEVGYGCIGGPELTICSPRGIRYRAVLPCRKCKRRRRCLVTLFTWYDPDVQCCTCFKSLDEWRQEQTTRKEAWALNLAAVMSEMGESA